MHCFEFFILLYFVIILGFPKGKAEAWFWNSSLTKLVSCAISFYLLFDCKNQTSKELLQYPVELLRVFGLPAT